MLQRNPILVVGEIEQWRQIKLVLDQIGVVHGMSAIVMLPNMLQPRSQHLKACHISFARARLLHVIEPGDGEPLPNIITMPTGLHMPNAARFDLMVHVYANSSIQLSDVTEEQLAKYDLAA